jgi:hypothetical protein
MAVICKRRSGRPVARTSRRAVVRQSGNDRCVMEKSLEKLSVGVTACHAKLARVSHTKSPLFSVLDDNANSCLVAT